MSLKEEVDMLNKYEFIEEKLGSGGFGVIYKCIDKTSNENCSPNTKQNNNILAIKIEKKSSNTKNNIDELHTEYKILSYLKGGIGFPKIYSYFQTPHYKCLVMELLGNNLSKIYLSLKHFSLLEFQSIALQAINRIEFLHSKNLIHCDIKPENFVIGREENNHLVYLIDFGTAKKYISSKTKMHIKFEPTENNNKLTPKYCSVNLHKGYTLSRRDDLISYMYMIIYFIKGFLPWDNQNLKQKDIRSIKSLISDCELCEGTPTNVYNMWVYVKNLRFDEKPDYKYLQDLIKGITESEYNSLNQNESELDYSSVLINKSKL